MKKRGLGKNTEKKVKEYFIKNDPKRNSFSIRNDSNKPQAN